MVVAASAVFWAAMLVALSDVVGLLDADDSAWVVSAVVGCGVVAATGLAVA